MSIYSIHIIGLRTPDKEHLNKVAAMQALAKAGIVDVPVSKNN